NAAREAGADIRTGMDVQAITVGDNGASGIVVSTGEGIASRAVVSSADPKRTLLGLVDPAHLSPEFLRRIQNVRMHGTLEKVNYAVSAIPRLRGLEGRDERPALSGRVRLARDIDAIERAFDAAKYGGYGSEPWIELTVPSIADETLAPSGHHVVSAYVQFAPYRLRDACWDNERDRLGNLVTQTIAAYAPAF